MNDNDIFLAAAQIEDPQVRAAFLDSVCHDDPARRQRIESLFAAFQAWEGSWDQFADKVAVRLANFDVLKQVDRALAGTQESGQPRDSQADRQESDQTGSVAPSPAAPLSPRRGSFSPGTKIGRYDLGMCLGVGGMGEVYLAFDSQLDRKVALKMLPVEFTGNPKWIQRFRREAKTVSGLNHPNILTIHEIGQLEQFHFMATEFVDGVTLRRLMSNRLLDLPQALDIATQIASALAAAHAANIVHRDIKPENIIVRHDGLVKVLDFGLAKQIESTAAHDATTITNPNPDTRRFETEPGVMMGTVRYMSPEQTKGLHVDARTDIFSFGILLYEALAGQLPFDGPTMSHAIVGILEHEPKPLHSFRQDVPTELERIVKKSLQKNREERYQTAKDLHLDLKHLQRELQHHVHSKNASLESAVRAGAVHLSRSAEWQIGFPAEAESQVPEVRYTQSGEVNIAFQVFGQGEFDLVFVMGWVSHLDWFWKERTFSRFLRRLASFARVILFDKRGTGLSDRVPEDELPTLEQRMDDVRAVMDAVGSERAVLCGVSEGGPLCSLFAATYPGKTIALVMIGSYARRLRSADYPWGPSDEQREQFFEEIRHQWGGPVGIEARAPSLANDPDFRRWWATYLRMGASPGAALALTRMNAQIDVRGILQTIQVPTLVIHRSGDRCLLVEEGKFLAAQIPGAKFVELPGSDHLPFVGNQDELLDEIEDFLTGVRHQPLVNRVLATVLYARILLGACGGIDRSHPSQSIAMHQAHVAREIQLFRGRTVQSQNDSMLATFDGPARAIRAASAIRDSARRLGLQLQIGVHTGECDVVGDRVEGAAVDLAASIANVADVGTVLVSNTVKDLVAGSGIRFHERLSSSLPDPLGEWRLFIAER